MNWSRIECALKQFTVNAKQKWGKLVEAGKRDHLKQLADDKTRGREWNGPTNELPRGDS